MNLRYHAEACRGSTRRWKPYGRMLSGADVHAIMAGGLPDWLKPNGKPLKAGEVVVCDHEDHLWGLTRGWHKHESDRQASEDCAALTAMLNTLGAMLPDDVCLAQYGLYRLHRWFDVPNGPTGLGVERLREYPDLLKAERDWQTQYQWAAIKRCKVITPVLYVIPDQNGQLGKNEIEWARLTIEFARNDGRRIMPIVSPRWNGGGQLMSLQAWMRFVDEVLHHSMQPDEDVMVWDALDHTIWQACLVLPPIHGAHPLRSAAREFIDGEIGKQDWSVVTGPIGMETLRTAYRRFYAKHISVMEMAADSLRQRGAA